MSKSRYSIANVLRQLRGARNALERTSIRYGRNDVVRSKLKRALEAVNEAIGHGQDAKAATRGGDRRAA